MPIHRMTVEDGVFLAKTVGYLDNMDGRTWSNALHKNAPQVAIIDLLDVDRICPTVVKIVADASRAPNLRTIMLVVSSTMSSQTARVVEKLAENANVRAFSTVEEAKRMARFQVTKAQSPAPAVTASFSQSFSFAGAW